VASVVCGVLALAGVIASLGLLFIVTLPLGVCAWWFGRRARRSQRTGAGRGLAVAGEVMGIVATLASCLALTACAMLVGSL